MPPVRWFYGMRADYAEDVARSFKQGRAERRKYHENWVIRGDGSGGVPALWPKIWECTEGDV